MRYPDEHKAAVREKIVAAAAHALRRDGIDGVSVPAIMKAVGLTHGGFYVHFRDRDELVSAAVRYAADSTATAVLQGAGGAHELLRSYVSREHATHPANGCVLATLGMEASRQRPAVRRTFADVARGFLRHINRRLHPDSAAGRISDASIDVATRMIGAIVLARIVEDEALADRILAVTRRPPSAPDESRA